MNKKRKKCKLLQHKEFLRENGGQRGGLVVGALMGCGVTFHSLGRVALPHL